MSTDDITILDTMAATWWPWFRDRPSWEPWRAFLAALFGLPLSDTGRELYQQCTGSGEPQEGGYTEAWLVVGRRGGKSMVLALIAVFLAVFRDWKPYLSPGERGTIKVMAVDRRQAKVIHRYCRALITEVPALASLVIEDNDDEIVLRNNIVIEIQTASFRSVRGYTVIAALLDEISFFRSDEEAANPDSEILSALRPAMATIPGAMLLAASSPYSKRGELYNNYRRYYGQENAPVLVWKAPTRVMNPTVPEKVIDDAIERDPDSAQSEYLAEFRDDISSFISREVVEALVQPGRYELSPRDDLIYSAFVDVSGGQADAFTWAIGHLQNETAIIDLLREVRPHFSPAEVTSQCAEDLARYRISEITGDFYGAEFTAERFRECGITYNKAEKPKSIIYLEMLPLLMSGRIELLDNTRSVHQLYNLERRRHRGGRDTIDHSPGGSDDLANALAGCAVYMTKVRPPAFWDLDKLKIAEFPGVDWDKYRQ
jgi:hypothetical protein